jgi:hypothetical protein
MPSADCWNDYYRRCRAEPKWCWRHTADAAETIADNHQAAPFAACHYHTAWNSDCRMAGVHLCCQLDVVRPFVATVSVMHCCWAETPAAEAGTVATGVETGSALHGNPALTAASSV